MVTRMLLMVFLLSVSTVWAQETPVLPEPQPLQATAADGLLLLGDFYPAAAENAPAVLLMHQNGSSRASWQPLLPALIESGYAVLAVDLRGHGETGGDEDWDAATGDVQTWLDTLRAQPGVRADAIATIGASIGSNLALVGCANDEQCVTAVALSPGLDFFGVQPEAAVTEGLRARSALLVAAQGDRESAEAVRQMLANAQGDIAARLYAHGRHGTNMFPIRQRPDDPLAMLILDWLNEHQPS